MGAVQHVFRRRATYWWRRRLIQKCGESGRALVAISLQTREPLVARTIAAHLTLESDRILREGYRSMLSAQQVKSLLATAVSDHLRKLNRVAALELADDISASEGRRSELIMGWALRLKAARGPNATIDPGDHVAILESGLSQEDIAEIGETIALLRKQGHSEAPRPKILQMLSLADFWRCSRGAVNHPSWSGSSVDGGGSPLVGASAIKDRSSSVSAR